MDRNQVLNMGDLLMAQERERFLANLLRKHGLTSLGDIRIFEAGCGGGNHLRLMVQWGASPLNLVGMDADPAATTRFATLSPGMRVHTAIADEVPEPDQSFDISLAFDFFGTVLDEDVAHAVARELFRITKPGGLIIVYDLRRKNPRDPRVHAVEEDDIRRWFPKCPLRVRPITVAPQLSRLAGRYVPWLYGGLSMIPPVRTHAFYVLRRPATSPFQ